MVREWSDMKLKLSFQSMQLQPISKITKQQYLLLKGKTVRRKTVILLTTEDPLGYKSGLVPGSPWWPEGGEQVTVTSPDGATFSLYAHQMAMAVSVNRPTCFQNSCKLICFLIFKFIKFNFFSNSIHLFQKRHRTLHVKRNLKDDVQSLLKRKIQEAQCLQEYSPEK